MTIQKYTPDFSDGVIVKESLPFTQICNKPLQNCRNIEALALWCHLQSRPENWILRPCQLREHFGIGRDKIYALLTYLIRTKLLQRHVHLSAKGTHISTTYTVLNGLDFLDAERAAEDFTEISDPLPCNQEMGEPLPDSPLPDSPDPVNQYYTKERCLKKKDINKNNNPSISPLKANSCFEKFWQSYPVKKSRKSCLEKWKRNRLDDISDAIISKLHLQIFNDRAWKSGFIPNPLTYINQERWNDELDTRSAYLNPSKASTDDFHNTMAKYNNTTKKGFYDECGNFSENYL